MHRRLAIGASMVALVGASALGLGAAPAFAGTEALVTKPAVQPNLFSHNKQNEPALAVDPINTNVLVSGSNDEIDLEACANGDPTTCPLHVGVGVSGVYFSFDKGHSWTQPTYTGYSERNCDGPAGAPCTPQQEGPIGTLPRYSENGLVSDGDPALAFGPKPDSSGHFSWSNGARLYYANLTSNFSSVRSETAFKGFEAVAVSRTDDVTTAAAGGTAGKAAWMPPVIVSKQNAALFSDKEQVWADNASSSPFFGRVYVCSAAFRSQEKGHALPQPLIVSVSRDGGNTWTSHQVTSATNNSKISGRTGCTVRTDSHGNAYVFFTQSVGVPGAGTMFFVKSTDGGAHWSRPQFVTNVVNTCSFFDPVLLRCVEDGVAGSRSDLSAAPSVDIANGAPSGSDATNEIVLTWVDGGAGLNHEKVMFTDSTNGGSSWSPAADVTRTGDRGYYSATSISPNGKTAYLDYMSWRTPFRHTTARPRYLDDVVLRSPLDTTGAPTGWTLLHRSPRGDARGTSQNNLQGEFLGDYVYAIATRSYGATVWTDARNAADCSAIDQYRQALENGGSPTTPAPNSDCSPMFGNSDIYGFTTAP